MLKWLKKVWKVLLRIIPWVITTLIFLFAAKKVTGLVRTAIVGDVKEPSNFHLIPGKDNEIIILNSKGNYDTVKLEKGVKASKVTAAGIAEGGKVHVEIKHKKSMESWIDSNNANGSSAKSYWGK